MAVGMPVHLGAATQQQAHRCVALQVCCLQLSKEGLTLRWEDVSKSLQSSVFLNNEVRALDHT